MRRALWPDEDADELAREAEKFSADGKALGLAAVLLSESANGELTGLVEIGLREYADGCSSSPFPTSKAGTSFRRRVAPVSGAR